MTTMEAAQVTGGVDTHKDTHVAAALDEVGRVLGTEPFPTTPTGYRQLWRWLQRHGVVVAVGVEGTGSWGAGLARYLTAEGATVLEVDRANRQHRRRHGKSDPADAIGAARVVQAGEATGTPKSANDTVEAIRMLRVARRSAIKARTQARQPTTRRHRHRPRRAASPPHRARRRPPRGHRRPLPASPTGHTRRGRQAHPGQPRPALAATRQRDHPPRRRTRRTDHPRRPHTAGDQRCRNPDRRRPAHRRRRQPRPAPHPSLVRNASSGRQQRHRLNRGGDRQANAALYTIAISRLRWDRPTQDYMSSRLALGHTRKEVIRCLKWYIARHVQRAITTDLVHPDPHATPPLEQSKNPA